MFCIHGSFLYCYFIFQKDGTEIQAFVAECQGQIVGLSVIRREEVIIHLNYSICIFPFCRNLLICVNKRYQYLVYKIYLYFLFMWHFDSLISWTIFSHSSEHRVHSLPLQHWGLYILQSPQARGPRTPPSLCLEPHL